MRSKRSPSYLFKTHQDIFYFRIRIPRSIRIKYNSPKSEIRKSLNTRDISVALKRARFLWVTMEETDYTMKNMESAVQEDNDGKKLLKQFLTLEMKCNSDSYFRDKEDETILDAFIGKLSEKGREVLNEQLAKWNKLTQKERDTALDEIRQEVEPKLTGAQELCTESKNYVQNASSKMLVTEAIDKFLKDRFEKRKRAGNSAQENAIDEFKGIYREFLSVIGDNLHCCDLNKDIIRQYENAIWNIPANHSRKTKYKSINLDEILKMDIPEADKRSTGTYNKHVLRVKQFLKWAGKHEYIKSGLESFLDPAPDNVNPNEKRELFKPDELSLLFNNDVYEKGEFKHPSRYWLPLLALFTGARAEELAQLYVDDIEKDKETSIHFINIVKNEERKQWLKNKSATRKIPIHSQLIKLGFLDFVKSTKSDSMLFPDLYNEKGKHYKKFGNNFNRKTKAGWKWICGVKRDNTSFHSFRHNVIDSLAKSKADDRVVCSIVGHHYKGAGLVENYIKPHELKVLQKTINLLDFPSIDWEKIRKRRW